MRMGTQNFSIGVWLRQLDNGYNVITESRGNNLIGYFFTLNYPPSGAMSIFINGASGQSVYTTTNTSMPIGVNQYIVVAINRIATTAKFYLNGVLFDTITGIHTNTISP
jgi:hypothetical protein